MAGRAPGRAPARGGAWRVTRHAPWLAALLALALLAGCGKKGAPGAPGPADQITYPRIYPTY